jgi:transcriptional regulator with XRE-family HTH domain
VDREAEDARKQIRREASDVFASNLRRLRKARGLTQEDLSSRAELNRIHVGLIERGARLPALDTVFRLAGALGVRPGDLFDGYQWQPEGNDGVSRTVGEPPGNKDKGS